MTRGELLDKLSSREIAEWQAYDSLDPIGGRRGDIQAGVVASTVANVFRSNDSKAYGPADFMPQFGAPARLQEEEAGGVERLISRFRALTLGMGGEIRSKAER